MDLNVYNIDDTNNEQIKNHVKQHESFTLTDIKHMAETVRTVEKIIEDNGLKCRVITDMRAVAAGAAIIPVFTGSAVATAAATAAAATAIGAVGVAGLASTIGFGIHRLATLNPDYEIRKNYLGNSLNVTYQK